MLYLSEAVANGFLEVARSVGEPVDPMKIQKLVYFSHGWHLGYGLGALSAEPAEAWRWGPVFPELYHAVKTWGSGPIMKPVRVFEFADGKLQWNTPGLSDGDTHAKNLIQRVWDQYGHLSGPALSQLTHEHDGPWYRTWNGNPGVRNLVIPNALIRDYFAGKIAANAGRA
jgi:uncharacterized phage-associated protein